MKSANYMYPKYLTKVMYFIYYPMRPNLENGYAKCPYVTMEDHTSMSNRMSTAYLLVPKENEITGHAMYIAHSIVMYIIAEHATSKLRAEYDLSTPFVATDALVTKTRLELVAANETTLARW
jgi:hypothetical protein